MRTVVLVDFLDGGHHLGWLVQFAESLVRMGDKVICLYPDHEIVRTRIAARLPQQASRVQTFAVTNPVYARLGNGRIRRFFEAIRRWRQVARILRGLESPPDLVFFTWLDECLALGVLPWLVELIFPFRWAGLYFHPWMERVLPTSKRPSLLRWDACLRARNCCAVAILDEGVAHKIERHIAPKPLLVFPDFAASAEEDQPTGRFTSIRSAAAGRTVVSALGSLTLRKGVSTLLQLALRDDVQEFFFVFAGKLALESFPPEDRSLWERVLANSPDNCFFHVDTIGRDSDFDSLVRDSDIIYAAYHQFHHSSNLLAKAAQFQKPVVVSRGFCMEERVERFSLGIAVEEGNAEESLAALCALRKETEAGSAAHNRQFADYSRSHSTGNLEQCLQHLLEIGNPLAAPTEILTLSA